MAHTIQWEIVQSFDYSSLILQFYQVRVNSRNTRINKPHSNTGLTSMGGCVARASILKWPTVLLRPQHYNGTWLPGTDNEPRECVAKQSTEKGMTQSYRTLGSLAPT